MQLLIEHVQNYRSAQTLEQRLAFSELIIGWVGPQLRECIARGSVQRCCLEDWDEAFQ